MLNLKKFKIEKLNGDQFISINFIDNKKIVVAENGSGKTTIMNILYYCLKNNINGLKKYDFETCHLEFYDGRKITFEKNKLDVIENNDSLFNVPVTISSSEKKIILNKINDLMIVADKFFINNGFLSLERFFVDFVSYLIETQNYNLKDISIVDNNRSSIYKILKNHGFIFDNIDTHLVVDRLAKITYSDLKIIYFYMQRDTMLERDFFYSSYDILDRKGTRANRDFMQIFVSVIRFLIVENTKDNEEDKKLLNSLKIIFLPTYRRIEQDSIDLLSGEFSVKEGSILSFGINDVIMLFNKITDKINSFTRDSFNEINNSALNDFISGEYNTDTSLEDWLDKDEEYFDNVLQRVGTQIALNNHSVLKRVFVAKSSDNEFLLTLINRMCKIYDKQLKIENEIVGFTDVCNKYLFNKKIVYERENLKIKIKKYKRDGTFKDIKLPSLSSGEKQIISIFAKLYLSHLPDIDINKSENQSSGYWVLFDEPELSLSVDWQEILLPDILKSNRCDFIFATTHSPFIFNNELKYYTSSINECIEEE